MAAANSRGVLSIEVCYSDEHLLELATKFRNNDWGASATAYTDRQSLLGFSRDLSEFCSALKGYVRFEAGSTDGVGYLSLRFYAVDERGHLACHLKVATSAATDHRPEEVWSVSIELHLEPAALDSFAAAISRMANSSRGRATLDIFGSAKRRGQA